LPPFLTFWRTVLIYFIFIQFFAKPFSWDWTLGCQNWNLFFRFRHLKSIKGHVGFYLAHTNSLRLDFFFSRSFFLFGIVVYLRPERISRFCLLSVLVYLFAFFPLYIFIMWVNDFRHLILFSLLFFFLTRKKKEKRKADFKDYQRRKWKNVEENIGIIYFWEKYFSLLIRTKSFSIILFCRLFFFKQSISYFLAPLFLLFFCYFFSSSFFFFFFFSSFFSPLGIVCSHNKKIKGRTIKTKFEFQKQGKTVCFHAPDGQHSRAVEISSISR